MPKVADGQEVLESVRLAPLFQALADESGEVRLSAFEALTRLPLSDSGWREIGSFVDRALKLGESAPERLAVIDGAPWIPVRSVQEQLTRIATESEGEDRAHGAQALAEVQRPTAQHGGTPLHPEWARGRPVGFTSYPAAEAVEARAALARLDLSRLFKSSSFFNDLTEKVEALSVPTGLVPAAVSMLFEEAITPDEFGDPPGIAIGNSIVTWVEAMQGRFSPELEGLFAVYAYLARRLFTEYRNRAARSSPTGAESLFRFVGWDDEATPRWLCYQIGWTVSRGGLNDLVSGLGARLTSGDREERMAAAYLIADAADYILQPDAPLFGGGRAPARRRMRDELVDDSPRSLDQLVAEEFRRLAIGSVLFNPPQQMRVGARDRVEVRISLEPPTAQLLEGLKGHGVPQTESIKVGTFMKARLLGDAFDVRALSSEEQVVTKHHHAQWEWDVTALHHGTHMLSLAVTVRLKIPSVGEELMDHPVLDRSIKVRVNPGYAIIRFVRAYWQWILGTIIGSGIIGWLWQTLIHR